MRQYEKSTSHLVRLSVFFAIILIQSWVPMLGYISINALNVTFIQVTVILATLWMGRRAGVAVGTFWGLNSWARATFVEPTPINVNVMSSPFVTILPRLLMPLLLAFLLLGLRRVIKSTRVQALIAGVLGSSLNTILVLGAIAIFRQQAVMELFSLDVTGFWLFIQGIVLSNGVGEAILSGILTPIVYEGLLRIRPTR